ncbi:MAG: pyridoxal phosphate-dependent aminotransferase [Euryarchaeota archaeon]|nr:pyridoxal phosphate-dependent aminotransferase [Euryarchaeota archaeon]
MFSARVLEIEPFQVMEILAEAQRLERLGEKVVHLEIGEPDFPTPERVVEEACRAMRRGDTHYTDARGRRELRAAIAGHLRDTLGVEVDPSREVLVTGGVSLGLQFVLASLLEPGDEVLVPDPGYPCYPNFVRFFGAKPVGVALEEDGSLSLEGLQEKLGRRTKAVLLNTPANPTGTYLSGEELRAVCELASEAGAWVVSDEIYSGLIYDGERSPSVLETGYERCVMLDGFSKLYAMTGWRLGYLVAPSELTAQVLKLQQNFYISPSSFAQRAAVVALSLRAELEAMKREFDRRRRYVVERLRRMRGVRLVHEPRAAYYAFPDVSEISRDSARLARYLLRSAGVAVTPGSAFGTRGEGHLRISYAASFEAIAEGMDRMEAVLEEYPEGG